MNSDKRWESIPTEFLKLWHVAERIKHGVKGVDFLVLENDDEMKGYESTELETEFREATECVTKIIKESRPEMIATNSDIVVMLLEALVNVQPAVDAYRSRLFAFATDWGSEVSTVGGWSQYLLAAIESIVKVMPEESRRKVFNTLSAEIKSATIEVIYWVAFDEHGSYRRRVSDILLGVGA